MPKTISSRIGRLWLMGIIGAGFVGALLSLFGVFPGAISSENMSNALLKIVGFYIPLLTLVATFFFQENRSGRTTKIPFEAVAVALFIVLSWSLTPILLLLFVWYIEDVLGYIDKLIPVGQSLALLALGYFFAKKPT